MSTGIDSGLGADGEAELDAVVAEGATAQDGGSPEGAASGSGVDSAGDSKAAGASAVVDARLAEARELTSAGDYQGAHAAYREVLVASPANLEARLGLARL